MQSFARKSYYSANGADLGFLSTFEDAICTPGIRMEAAIS